MLFKSLMEELKLSHPQYLILNKGSNGIGNQGFKFLSKMKWILFCEEEFENK